jgi:hypothetical protein
MTDPSPIEPLAALPYETANDPPANVVVLMRLADLFLAAAAVQYFLASLGYCLQFMDQPGGLRTFGLRYLLSSSCTAAVALVLCGYLWKKIPSLALRFFGRSALETSADPTRNDFLAVALIAVGVFELIEAVDSAATVAAPLVVGAGGRLYERGTAWAYFVPALVRAGFGFWLVVGTDSVLALIRRHSGRYADPPPVDRSLETDQTHHINGS